jgi:8-oxo-(d)GTP phosphatase
VVPDLSGAGEPDVLAAGAVLWRLRDGRLEVCVIHRPRYDDWTLPKGKLDRGEHILAAAVREVEEETGHRVTLGRPLPGQRYRTRNGMKSVWYWAARADDEAPPWEPTAEVDEVAFLPVGDAISRLTHSHDAATVAGLAAGPLRTTPFVLLRHTKAVSRTSWTGPDRERPLSPRGLADAGLMIRALAAFGITRIASSDAVRCTETVLPYARERGFTVDIEPLLSEDGFADAPDRAAEAIRKLLADDVPTVVCSHRPALPGLLAAATERARCATPTEQLPPGGFHALHHRGGVVIDIETHPL